MSEHQESTTKEWRHWKLLRNNYYSSNKNGGNSEINAYNLVKEISEINLNLRIDFKEFNSPITRTDTFNQWRIQKFWRGGGGRQCISPVVVYRRKRVIRLLYGKRRLIEKNSEPLGGGRFHFPFEFGTAFNINIVTHSSWQQASWKAAEPSMPTAYVYTLPVHTKQFGKKKAKKLKRGDNIIW